MQGYAGSILLADLSGRQTRQIPISDYAQSYLGGRGLAARLYWEQAIPDKTALDAANPLIITTGPLAGFGGLAGSRWQVCGKSPSISPQDFNYSNLGGSWGAHLKFAGFDALVISSAAQRPTYIYLHDGGCEFRDASHLWGKGATQTRDILKAELGQEVRVLTIGPAGENLVSLATLLADNDASGSSGFGAVMGSKKLKAVVVAGSNRPQPADPAKLEQLTRFLRGLKRQRLPRIPWPSPGIKAKRQACFGCIAGCQRALLETADGKRGKSLCGSGFFYEQRALKYYREPNQVSFLANRLCDDYGLDANAIEPMITWLYHCYRADVITEKDSGLPFSKIGSLEFIEELVQRIARRQGFGDTLAQGMLEAAGVLGSSAVALLDDSTLADGTSTGYCPRMYLTNALFFALEPRQSYPQTGEVGGTVWRWLDWLNGAKNPEVSGDDLNFIADHFWGGREAADFSTYRGKARAAKTIQDRQYAKESAILCIFSWYISAIELHRPGIVAEILSAVTGNEYDESGIYRLGERIFNLQRAIHLRQRRTGRQDDTVLESWFTTPVKESFMNPKLLVPGPNGEPVSREDSVLDRDMFESMKDEYYRLRGWDVGTGLPTESKLAELGLHDVAAELKKINLTC